MEVNFQFLSGEGKRAKLLPAAASFGSLIHFHLRAFHSTFDAHHTHSYIICRYDPMSELKRGWPYTIQQRAGD